ncbi:hypothetical protein C8Q76DRAFT_758847, partial [Earliella scabrosa]
MDTSTASSSAASSVSSSLAQGLQPEQGLNLLVVGVAFSAVLIPVVIFLFYFSTSHSRRRPVFISNFFALALGLTEGAILLRIMLDIVLQKTNPIPHYLTTLFAFLLLVPLLVQTLLLSKITTAYERLLSVAHRMAICAPPVTLKTVRIVMIALFLSEIQHDASSYHSLGPAEGSHPWGKPYRNLMVAWFLQLCDDLYVSAILVLRPRKEARNASHSHSLRLPNKWLFVTMSSFVLPVALDLAQVIMVFGDEDPVTWTYIPLVNGYVQIICVVLATTWDSNGQSDCHPEAGVHVSESAFRPDLLTSALHSRVRVPDDDAALSIKNTFVESIRDSHTQVGDDEAERLKWLAELGKDQPRLDAQSSICPSALLDNTGQPLHYYAV